MTRTIFIGADHGGFAFKEKISKFLRKEGYEVKDLGAHVEDSTDDYPHFAKKVAERVVADKTHQSRGILICGSGTGMAIAANKVAGIRAALAYDVYSARMAKQDNDANILTLRGRKASIVSAQRIIKAWLTTDFSGLPRHTRRIQEISKMEKKGLRQ